MKDNEDMADDLIRSENFRERNILGENFMAISSTPNYVNRRKCYGIGFTILVIVSVKNSHAPKIEQVVY